jgi:hypothetical protein
LDPKLVPEDLLPLLKLSYKFYAKYLDKSTLKQCVLLSKPKRAEANKAEYEKYMRELKEISQSKPNKRILSIQFFASHGYVIFGT